MRGPGGTMVGAAAVEQKILIPKQNLRNSDFTLPVYGAANALVPSVADVCSLYAPQTALQSIYL